MPLKFLRDCDFFFFFLHGHELHEICPQEEEDPRQQRQQQQRQQQRQRQQHPRPPLTEEEKEVSMTNIDRVYKLIIELKEQDLSSHKKRIQERVRVEGQ